MAEIRRYPALRHFRGEPSQHILRYRAGRLVNSGRGLSFWFHPLSTSVAAIPVDDRELAFLFHGRSKNFQETTVQGVATYRISDAARIADRVDFTIDLATGAHRYKPLEKIAAMLTELAQQLAIDYLARTDLQAILTDGADEVRRRIEQGLRDDPGLAAMGLEIVSVRVSAVSPSAEVDHALQVPVRESIQQNADEATFRRRAQAVEKERAIQENELQNKIELAKREQQLIQQKGENDRHRATDEADAARIAGAGAAERVEMEARAKAVGIKAVEEARVGAERDRMTIYREFPAEQLFALAGQELAAKLTKIEHVNITPDLLATLVNSLGHGTQRLLTKEA